MIAGDPVTAAGVAAFVLLVFALGLLGRRARAAPLPDERLKVVETRLGEVEHRLDAVQADSSKLKHDVGGMRMAMQRLATIDAVNDVKVQVAEIKGKVDGLGQSLTDIRAGLGRVENFLMDATAKAIARGDLKSGETK